MAGYVEGKIVAIGPTGNLISDITAAQLQGVPRNAGVRVECDEHVTYGVFDQEHGQPERTLVALIGPSNCLELCIVGDSAHEVLGVSVGQSIRVSW